MAGMRSQSLSTRIEAASNCPDWIDVLGLSEVPLVRTLHMLVIPRKWDSNFSAEFSSFVSLDSKQAIYCDETTASAVGIYGLDAHSQSCPPSRRIIVMTV